MKKIAKMILGVMALAVLIAPGCKHDEHDHNHENELITTVKVHLVPPGGGMVMATWKDLTPNEPTGVTVDTLRLDSGLVYSGRIELTDETVNPAVDRTSEIEKEKDEHLFVYKQTPSSPALLDVSIADTDSKGRPFGKLFSLKAKNEGIGKFRVVLRHQPGTKDGTEGPGDTDVDVEIPFVVK
jgi:hypothetical protein